MLSSAGHPSSTWMYTSTLFRFFFLRCARPDDGWTHEIEPFPVRGYRRGCLHQNTSVSLFLLLSTSFNACCMRLSSRIDWNLRLVLYKAISISVVIDGDYSEPKNDYTCNNREQKIKRKHWRFKQGNTFDRDANISPHHHSTTTTTLAVSLIRIRKLPACPQETDEGLSNVSRGAIKQILLAVWPVYNFFRVLFISKNKKRRRQGRDNMAMTRWC